MKVTIEIEVDEFDDFLDVTLDDLVAQHGQQIATYLGGFLIGVGRVTTVDSRGRSTTWRF